MNPFKLNISRRQFIKLFGAVSASALLSPNLAFANISTNKRLVLIEMNGGNDGLNTVIPYSQGAYYDLRPKLSIPEANLNHINNDIGLHPALKKLFNRYKQNQVAIVQGVGHPAHDLSHFVMMDAWRAGNPNGTNATNQTGWVGRLLDVISPANSLTGISVDNSIGQVISAQQSIIANLYSENYPYIPYPYQDLIWPAVKGMAVADESDTNLISLAKKGIRNNNLILDVIPQLQPGSVTYQNNETSRLFDLSARALSASPDIRAVHIPLPMDFDTHRGQPDKLNNNFIELDDALENFMQDLTARNLAEYTTIILVSEFGRRVAENNSLGTDHGTANNTFIIGTHVKGGIYGSQPSLTDLDDDGNLKMSISYLDVFASICEGWFNIDSAQILPSGTAMNLFL